MSSLKAGDRLAVIKLDTGRVERWRYDATVMEVFPEGVLVEAFFNRSDDLPFHGITFHPGDLFLEMYYLERRYNIYEVYDRETRELKCWYCNASRPVEIEDGNISYVDLALDLLVFPDGAQLLLDEEEFAKLKIDENERKETLQAMNELQEKFKTMGNIHFSEGRV
jgi:uncharacterized protein